MAKCHQLTPLTLKDSVCLSSQKPSAANVQTTFRTIGTKSKELRIQTAAFSNRPTASTARDQRPLKMLYAVYRHPHRDRNLDVDHDLTPVEDALGHTSTSVFSVDRERLRFFPSQTNFTQMSIQFFLGLPGFRVV